MPLARILFLKMRCNVLMLSYRGSVLHCVRAARSSRARGQVRIERGATVREGFVVPTPVLSVTYPCCQAFALMHKLVPIVRA